VLTVDIDQELDIQADILCLIVLLWIQWITGGKTTLYSVTVLLAFLDAGIGNLR